MRVRCWVRVVLSLWVVLGLVACSALNAYAQTEAATIRGSVTDSSGAVVSNAAVRLVDVDRGTSKELQTDSRGFYSFASVAAGRYRMEVEKSGFRLIHLTGITANVQDNLEENFKLDVGAVSESITVEANALNVNTTDAAVSTVIDRTFVESLPLNGRSFNTLLQLTPGVVIVPSQVEQAGQFNIAGQRSNANNFTVDGVSANFGVGSTFVLSGSGAGATQAFSALGGTSSLVSVEALEEFRIETSSFAPEFGRSPGGQVVLTTRSGTNRFNGGVYEYFRNTVMDANDWFANSAGNPRAPEHHNDFGGFLGGPIWKNKTFFFLSYEGSRLDLPQTMSPTVPYTAAPPCSPPAAIAPFLNAYPKPTGAVSVTNCTGTFTASFSNPATLNAGSLRVDHTFNSRFSIFGRYNDAPSETVRRIDNLTTLATTATNTRTLTLGSTIWFSNRMVNSLRVNWSRQSSSAVFTTDSFGGAVPADPRLLLSPLSGTDNLAAFLTFDTSSYFQGPNARNKATQLNFVDDLSVTLGAHQLKLGADYRDIYLDQNANQHQAVALATSINNFLATGQVFLSTSTVKPSQWLTQSLSIYGQDTWKVGPRLTLTYGLRWELGPAPSPRGASKAASWTNVNNAAAIALAPFGTPLWHTTYSNFAPRVGLAYSLTENGDFVLRAGAGVFYDLGLGSSTSLTSSFPNAASQLSFGVSLPVTDVSPFLPVISTQPPYPNGVNAFSPDLRLPRSYQWNVALEKSFGAHQAVSATYAGQAGRDLLRQQDLFQPNTNFSGAFFITSNDATSDYNAFQLQYRRRLVAHLQALANYNWSHSLDNASNDLIVALSNTLISGAKDRGSSDFDVRHSFSGAISYEVPAAAKSGVLRYLTTGWTVDAVVIARTGVPFNAVVQQASPDPSGFVSSRPDRVAGQPVFVHGAQCIASLGPPCAGGKGLNPAAFSVPLPVRQGTEGRNDITGFGLTQIDISLGRRINIGERLNVQFRADAFNVFNHPNFANPPGLVEFGPSNLQSQQMLNQALGGGLNALFQEGGPRSLQLSLKLNF
jgi:hypothetical protein